VLDPGTRVPDLRERETDSIRSFIGYAGANGYLRGRVLDYGCGQEPYKDLVERAGGVHVGYDRAGLPANVSGRDVNPGAWPASYDTILCTQVLQYVPSPKLLLETFLHFAPILVMTYPTNWPEVESVDLHRFTKTGMTRLLEGAGFRVVLHEFRHGFEHEGVSFTCGYGVIARR
jgi:hypothetical protein